MNEELVETILLPVSGIEAVVREGNGAADKEILKFNLPHWEFAARYAAKSVVSLNGKENCTVQDIQALLVPDIEYLLVAIFRVRYGDFLKSNRKCSKCNFPNSHAKSILPQSDDNPDGLPYVEPLRWGPNPNDPTVEDVLPRSGKRAVVGMITGKKEATILSAAADAGGIDPNLSDMQCLRSLGGVETISYRDVIALPPRDHERIRGMREELICGYDPNITLACQQCGDKEMFNLFMDRRFFLPAG